MKYIYSSICVLFFSCSSPDKPKTISVEIPILTETNHEKIEAIYYGVPSPMETTIILKNNCPIFSNDVLFPDIISGHLNNKQSTAILLGIISADLNYAILSDRPHETSILMNKVINLAKLLHLDAVVNENIKQRVENNLSNKDSMQIIIGNTFWEIENKLKQDENYKSSAMIITGGWLEGIYLACKMAKLYPENHGINNVVAEQKFVLENLIELNSEFKFDEHIHELIINDLIKLKSIYENVTIEYTNPKSTSEEENSNEIVIGNYFNLKFDVQDIEKIDNLVNELRNKVITQLL